MTTQTSFLVAALPAALLAACGGGSDAGGDDSGGNVGFGGAQDIGQFRGILDAGGIPGENTLDANGFFSEHYSALPPPDCGQVLCVAPMLSVGRDWLNGSYQATLQIAMTTPVDPATLERLPLNLVAVVDRSGSMISDGRMDKVKQGLHLLIDSLEPGDRLALVQFDDAIDVLSTLATLPDPAALHAQVTAMYPRGATNIYGGLEAGFELAAAALDPARQNRIILLSDGIATAGELDPDVTIAMADGFVSDGISLSTIGVGLQFDVDLMRGLAEHGAGNFYFLEDAAAVNEVFTQELETSLTTLAVDVRIGAVPGGGYQLGEVIGTRAWTSTSDGGQAWIPAVFVASRDSQQPDPGRRGGGGSIFIDVTPIAGAITDGRVAEVNLSYRLPGSSEVIIQTVAITNPIVGSEAPPEPYVSLQAMLEHYAAYNLFLGLREATRLAAYHYTCALSALTALRDSATRFNSVFADPDVAADIVLIDQFSQNLIAAGAVPEDAPTQGQCAAYDPDDPSTYPPDDGSVEWDVDDTDAYGCAADAGAGRGGRMTLILVAAALLGARRRRSR